MAGQSEERVQALSIIMLHLCSGLQYVQEPTITASSSTTTSRLPMQRQRSQQQYDGPPSDSQSGSSTAGSIAGSGGGVGGRKSPFRSRRLSVCRKRALGIFQRSASVSASANATPSGYKSESAN
uniref:Uncharacterized protein n=1 Tax=Anopheles melas TaxID=34690 RepID=A0A182UF05_9DIPT